MIRISHNSGCSQGCPSSKSNTRISPFLSTPRCMGLIPQPALVVYFLRKLGFQDTNLGAGRCYNQSIFCQEAAARGDGIAVGDEILARPYLEDARLIVPFTESMPSPESYYILTSRNENPNQEYVEFFTQRPASIVSGFPTIGENLGTDMWCNSFRRMADQDIRTPPRMTTASRWWCLNACLRFMSRSLRPHFWQTTD